MTLKFQVLDFMGKLIKRKTTSNQKELLIHP